jgi:hypothetical protein
MREDIILLYEISVTYIGSIYEYTLYRNSIVTFFSTFYFAFN